MNEVLKDIIPDISSFKELIEKECLYIDKTMYFHRLVSSKSKYFFLSRPRRFGKSLMVSTLESLFKGEKELFKGLYIEDKWNFDDIYPVIHLDMSNVTVESEQDLITTLRKNVILPQAEALGIDTATIESENNPSVWMNYLITGAVKKYGKKVVILIDEYDNPLLSSVKTDHFEIIRSRMENLYNPLKPRGTDIHFCFITGVTRFSQVSIFSKLNNLVNITENSDYAAICGYTDEELDHYFTPYFEKYFEESRISSDEEKKAFRESVREYYDGYRFTLDSDATLYNPVSIGNFVTEKCRKFKNFWIETGGQTLVRQLLAMHPHLFADRKEFYIAENSTNSFEANTLFSDNVGEDAIYSYLMQVGYLTYLREEIGIKVLGYPNNEVADSVSAFRLSSMGLLASAGTIDQLRVALAKEDIEKIVQAYRLVFSKFPHEMKLKREENFHAAFYAFTLATKYDVEAEESSGLGQLDVRIAVNDSLYYIIELKLNESGQCAVDQVYTKKYYSKFFKEGRKIHVLGLNFSSATRNIEDWKKDLIEM